MDLPQNINYSSVYLDKNLLISTVLTTAASRVKFYRQNLIYQLGIRNMNSV